MLNVTLPVIHQMTAAFWRARNDPNVSPPIRRRAKTTDGVPIGIVKKLHRTCFFVSPA
jgi:hypothetical protein